MFNEWALQAALELERGFSDRMHRSDFQRSILSELLQRSTRYRCVHAISQQPGKVNRADLVTKGLPNPDNRAHLVFQCPGERWCCTTGEHRSFRGEYNISCCDNKELVFSAGAAVVYTTATVSVMLKTLSSSARRSSAASSIPIRRSSTQATSTALAALSSSTSSAKAAVPSLSTGAKLGIGIGVGAPAAIILIGVLCVMSWRAGRSSERSRSPLVHDSKSEGRSEKPELPCARDPVELDVWKE